jgi:carbon storage regulator
MSVVVMVNGEHEATLNDPSDAAAWLKDNCGLPVELFMASPPDVAPALDDLPLTFYWSNSRYEVKQNRVDQTSQSRIQSSDQTRRGVEWFPSYGSNTRRYDNMLVLTRGKNEQIVIGENREIVVEVVEVQGGKVRLGIQAPKEVPVHRREVIERMDEEKRDAEKRVG